MLATLDGGAEFVVGSRFVEGGSTDDDWGAVPVAEQPGGDAARAAAHVASRTR